VSGCATVAGHVAGQPGVEVTLLGVGEAALTRGEAIEQCDGRSDMTLDGDRLAVRGARAVVARAQSTQQMPYRVAVEQLSLLWVGAVLDGACDPAF
jgi:hypothetical protein